MAPNKLNGKSSAELANDLLRKRAVLVKSHQGLSEVASRVRNYERHYKIKSEVVHQAINRGELKETQDVCRWLMDYDLLRRTKPR